MGALHQQPLAGFVQFLQARFAIETFVETGTFRGDATEFAARVFPRVASIEVDPECHRVSAQRLASTQAELILGDSRAEIPKLVATLTRPALFWLDGHAGGGFHGAGDDCPLLDELSAIAESPFEHFILVDDARAFLAPPPPPFDADKWPELADVLAATRRRFPYYCVVVMDVLIAVPPTARPYVKAFCDRVRPKI
jgi:hypothetical protein